MGMTIDCISRVKAIEEADKLCLETGYDNEKVEEMLRELPSVTPQEPTTKNDLALIHTEGLDEGIRCAMCTNSMKNDRGCDGSCVVDNAMYKKVMDVIESNIANMPTVTPQEPRWIPVSERLPESDEEYHTFLVTDNKGKVTLSEFYLSISDRKPYWSGMIDVVAWMPLPKPYEPQESEG